MASQKQGAPKIKRNKKNRVVQKVIFPGSQTKGVVNGIFNAFRLLSVQPYFCLTIEGEKLCTCHVIELL
ncbi:hypothetical protein SAMN05661012_04876 [Chitinophaga sancti]|uniref:Uncharacterized protein n=1 Tax=Chitinophaga sancti TaxID=1004 RepID=A0A1K1S7D2_9BACT|nr:hypothetical protein SAMN05661012_04876 [Chitinophaga sancti]